MLTRNYWRIFGGMMARLNGNAHMVTVTLPDGTTLTEGVLTSSSRPYSLLGTIAAPLANSSYGSNTVGCWYGRGTTPSTLDDIALEDPITDGSLTSLCGGLNDIARVEGVDHYRFSAVHQVTNNTSEELTISEVGCFGSITSGGKAVLMDRTVLETPIVIPPKETVSVEYVIKFPYGT